MATKRSRMVVRRHEGADALGRLSALEGVVLKVGVFGDERHQSGPTVAEVAGANEYGTDRIPARPFMRTTFDKREAEITQIGEELIDRVAAGTIDAEVAPQVLGAAIVGMIQEMISSSIPPPNAPATIARKGSSGTLIDTGQLRQSVTHAVEK